jgi:hypothetical protein
MVGARSYHQVYFSLRNICSVVGPTLFLFRAFPRALGFVGALINEKEAIGVEWRLLQNVIDHYESPKNVGTLDKKSPNVGTGNGILLTVPFGAID